jgi:membrane-bound serine protease (ClpP class)
VLAVVIPFGIIMTAMLRLAIKARRAKVTTGTAGMIGLTGRAATGIAPEGTVFVRGELWRARSNMNIARGEDIRVTGIEGLTLDVEADNRKLVAPPEASAIEESATLREK